MHASLGRLIWKEYRAQRSVWLALVLGTWLLHALPFLLDPQSRPELVSHSLGVAAILGACYAVASGSILFAGEREDATVDWLRQLPLPAARLTTAKIVAAVVGVILFALAVSVSALAAMAFERMPFREFRNVDGGFPLWLYARSMIGGLAWGILFSLLTRRVLVAVALAIVAEIATAAMAGNLFRTPTNSLYFSIVALVALIDVSLALRWARGDIQLALPGLRAWSVPASETRARGWLRLVAWASARRSPLSRITAALLWRELRAAVPFAAVAVMLGVLCVELLPRAARWFPSHLIFIACLPVVCGLMTCLGDQRRQSFRFLVDRGVSPTAVYCVKHSVWLLIAGVLIAGFTAWDAFLSSGFRARPGTAAETQAIPSLVDLLRMGVCVPTITRTPFADTPADRNLQWQFASSACLCVYAFAQLCAFWVRRAVLAAATALIGGIVLGLWHVVAVAADVPLAWAAWAFTIACFSATWAMSARWMHEDRHWTTRAFKVGWIVLPLLLVVIGARQYRATQVPLVDPGFDWQQRDREFREFDRPWSARWQSLQADLNVHGAHASGNDPGQAAERRGADRVARMRSALLELSEELDTRHGRLDPRSFGPLTGFPAFWLGRVAAEAAAEEGEQGRLNEAWRFQQAGERTTRYLAQQAASWGDWTGCLSAHDAVLNSIRTWAAHGDQTPASLGAALAFLQSGAAPTTAEEMFKNRYVLWRRIFEGRLRTDEDFESDPFPGAARRHLAWSGDLQRTQRLMAVITRPSLPVRLEFPGQPDTAAVPPETVSRWIAATPFLPHDFWSDAGTGTGLHARVDERFQLSLAEHGGTLLVLALHAWRLDHGEFPERLEQLTPDYVSHLPRDPFSTGGAGDYGYRRDGFPAKVLTSALHEVPAHQPLLWSAGPGGGHIVYNDRSQPSGAIPPWWYYATNYARWVTAREMGAPTTAGGLADPTRVRFVILGQPFPAGSIGSAPSPDESR